MGQMTNADGPILQSMGDGLWVHEQELNLLGVAIGRRTAVIRLDSGQLVLHATCRVDESLKTELAELGTVGWVIVPNRVHDAFFRSCLAAFPKVELCAPDGYRNKRAPERVPDVNISEGIPEAWQSDLDFHVVGGAPRLSETAFFHRPSRSLIFADLAFNIPRPPAVPGVAVPARERGLRSVRPLATAASVDQGQVGLQGFDRADARVGLRPNRARAR